MRQAWCRKQAWLNLINCTPCSHQKDAIMIDLAFMTRLRIMAVFYLDIAANHNGIFPFRNEKSLMKARDIKQKIERTVNKKSESGSKYYLAAFQVLRNLDPTEAMIHWIRGFLAEISKENIDKYCEKLQETIKYEPQVNLDTLTLEFTKKLHFPIPAEEKELAGINRRERLNKQEERKLEKHWVEKKPPKEEFPSEEEEKPKKKVRVEKKPPKEEFPSEEEEKPKKKVWVIKNLPKENPVEEVISQPIEKVISQPIEEVISQPAEEVISQPTEEVISQPTEEVISQPIRESPLELSWVRTEEFPITGIDWALEPPDTEEQRIFWLGNAMTYVGISIETEKAIAIEDEKESEEHKKQKESEKEWRKQGRPKKKFHKKY